MFFNPLFIQVTSNGQPAPQLKMQNTNGSSYLFSDIIKICSDTSENLQESTLFKSSVAGNKEMTLTDFVEKLFSNKINSPGMAQSSDKSFSAGIGTLMSENPVHLKKVEVLQLISDLVKGGSEFKGKISLVFDESQLIEKYDTAETFKDSPETLINILKNGGTLLIEDPNLAKDNGLLITIVESSYTVSESGLDVQPQNSNTESDHHNNQENKFVVSEGQYDLKLSFIDLSSWIRHSKLDQDIGPGKKLNIILNNTSPEYVSSAGLSDQDISFLSGIKNISYRKLTSVSEDNIKLENISDSNEFKLKLSREPETNIDNIKLSGKNNEVSTLHNLPISKKISQNLSLESANGNTSEKLNPQIQIENRQEPESKNSSFPDLEKIEADVLKNVKKISAEDQNKINAETVNDDLQQKITSDMKESQNVIRSFTKVNSELDKNLISTNRETLRQKTDENTIIKNEKVQLKVSKEVENVNELVSQSKNSARSDENKIFISGELIKEEVKIIGPTTSVNRLISGTDKSQPSAILNNPTDNKGPESNATLKDVLHNESQTSSKEKFQTPGKLLNFIASEKEKGEVSESYFFSKNEIKSINNKSQMLIKPGQLPVDAEPEQTDDLFRENNTNSLEPKEINRPISMKEFFSRGFKEMDSENSTTYMNKKHELGHEHIILGKIEVNINKGNQNSENRFKTDPKVEVRNNAENLNNPDIQKQNRKNSILSDTAAVQSENQANTEFSTEFTENTHKPGNAPEENHKPDPLNINKTENTRSKYSEDHLESESEISGMKKNHTESGLRTESQNIVKEKAANDTQLQQNPSKIIKATEIVKEIAKFLHEGNKNSIMLKLDPENLGSMKIQVEVINKMVNAQIEVDNEAAHKLVESHLPQIYNTLSQNGVQVNTLNISLNNFDQRNTKNLFTKKKTSTVENENLVDDKSIIQEKNMGYNTYEYLI